MRLKTLLILPIISFIGLSLSLHFIGSLIVGLVIRTFKRNVKPIDNKKECEDDRQVIEAQESVHEMWKCRKCGKPVYFGMTYTLLHCSSL